ncbi:Meiotic recombination protein dmc1 [Ascosphaera pollenicola]|nr:Meiotic recombination protein dmc1 [Ascosphaera pollenicola]
MSSSDDHQVRGAGAIQVDPVEDVLPVDQEKGTAVPAYDAGVYSVSPDHKEAKNVEVDIYAPGSGPYDMDNGAAEKVPWHKTQRFKKWYRVFVHLAVFVVATGLWVASLALHAKDKNWVVPFLVWLCVVLRLVTFYVPARYVLVPFRYVWEHVALRAKEFIPHKWRTPLSALFVLIVFCLGAFCSEPSADNNRLNRGISLIGILVLIATLYAFSKDRKRINWQTVIVGMLAQFIVALFVLRSKVGYDIFKFVSDRATDLLGFADKGTAFLTSDNVVQTVTFFLITVLPAAIFFISIVSILYYIGLLQWCVVKAATFFFWSMRVSGAEAIVAAASPFIGQGESAMLIKPFIKHLTRAEIHQVMCSGYATIAGSVLVSYISMGVNPQALVSSCVMSIPASLAMSKIRWPETEETLTAGRVVIPEEEDKAVNILHAFTNGAWTGLKIAAVLAANLLCIISLIALINALLAWVGRYLDINDPQLSLELILGYLCCPIAFFLGVPRNGDLYKVAKLIGLKLITNEFVAYNDLIGDEYKDITPRSRLIATYALCGFANLGSLGNQIGVLSQLSPERGGDVSTIAFSAMLTGAFSTFTSAAVAGMLVQDTATWTD